MFKGLSPVLLLTICALPASAGPRAKGVPADFKPDPRSVQWFTQHTGYEAGGTGKRQRQRYGPAYRYPQAGWVVLHIEGEPYARGYQHGRLMAPEIAAHLRCFAAVQSPKAPADGWKLTRTLVNALFVRRYDKEYLEEMRGIADGATAAGARFNDRPIDLVDIVGLNSWPEIDTLDSALNATANGLEGIRFRHSQLQPLAKPKPMHCSAFAATGPATADGKIVFGHITMFSLYPSLFYNVWLDVKPSKGHRVLMQTYPGGMQSGLDYYLNSAGILVCETTIAQTRFDGSGLTVASRIRQALQYADTIDKVVEVLKKSNNGLYTNEWLLADTKTNEIAMFELGTHRSKLYRSSRGEWFGGTAGFYWGCNNTKDVEVRLETVASVKGRPANVVFHPSDRDKAWLRLFARYKGRIDADFGKVAFTTPPIAAFPSLDAKFTTTDLARDLKTWALYGPPLGRTWKPTREEWARYPEIRPLVSNPWTVLHAQPPARVELDGPVVADLPNRLKSKEERSAQLKEDRQVLPPPAWHGTLLPKTDADAWLAAAFADYEKIYALEKSLRHQASKKGPRTRARHRSSLLLFGHRAAYLAAARSASDVPLAKTRSELTRDEWYRVASGKGVWVLHELRRLLGDESFEKVMDSFGREHAGKSVTAAEFQTHVSKESGQRLDDFFAYWLNQPGLPVFQLGRELIIDKSTDQRGAAAGYQVLGEIHREGKTARTTLAITVETAQGEVTREISIEAPVTRFKIETREFPQRVIVDKYGRSARANGGAFGVRSFTAEPEKTLIVYGTADEVPANRETAEALQHAIIREHSNYAVPIKSDKEATDEDLKAHHLLLIGRPDSNTVVERFRAALPVTFGSRSMVVGNKSYAHAHSAVIAAGENPLNKRYAVVVVAGLSAEATLRAVPVLMKRGQLPAEVLLLANGERTRALVLPARDLVRQIKYR